MKLTYETEEQILEKMLLKKGDYHYEVIDASEEISKKSGADMIKLSIRIYDDKDKAHFINCYLLESFKIILVHFLKTNDLWSKYEQGLVCATDCIGKKGVAKVDIDFGKNSDYPPKNVIKDFIESKQIDFTSLDKAVMQDIPDGFDTDIPF